MPKIEFLLAEEVTLYPDGGGKVKAAKKIIQGAQKISKFLVGIQKAAAHTYHLEVKEINGGPGMVIWLEDQLQGVCSFHIEEGKIKSIYVILNPEKLKYIKRQCF